MVNRQKTNKKLKGAFTHYERWVFLLAAFVIGLALHLANYSAATADAATTFTPGIIPMSAAEITNPGRGQYLWYPQYHPATQPSGQPAGVDLYSRWAWRDIEPTQGNYNYGAIDTLLASAKTHGG